jgi:hypothetical protein
MIPVDRLTGYIWDQEGGSWLGRSMLRDIYKNWLLKDRLVRIDVINHEKAGGVPWAEAQPGATSGEVEALHQMMRNFKIGENSGGAVPAGAKVNVARSGNTDVIGSVQYHDEAMARKFLLMLIQLGQTSTGSRALGNTFAEFFFSGQQSIAEWYVDNFNEHVIEDWWNWNYGDGDDNVARLKYNADIEIAVDDLTKLITAKAIVVDSELEISLRKELGLPRKAEGAKTPEELTQSELDVQTAKAQPPMDQKALDKEGARQNKKAGDTPK